MLIIISFACRTSKPASASRCTARSTLAGSETKLPTVLASGSTPGVNSEAPVDCGEAIAKIRSGKSDALVLRSGFFAAAVLRLRLLAGFSAIACCLLGISGRRSVRPVLPQPRGDPSRVLRVVVAQHPARAGRVRGGELAVLGEVAAVDVGHAQSGHVAERHPQRHLVEDPAVRRWIRKGARERTRCGDGGRLGGPEELAEGRRGAVDRVLG